MGGPASFFRQKANPWVAHGQAHSKSGPTNNFIQFVCFIVLIVKLLLIYALCLLIN
jgi:hypothetical protein